MASEQQARQQQQRTGQLRRGKVGRVLQRIKGFAVGRSGLCSRMEATAEDYQHDIDEDLNPNVQ